MSKRKNKGNGDYDFGDVIATGFKVAIVGTAVVTAAVIGGSVILGKLIKDKIEESSSHDNQIVQPDTLLMGDAAGDDFDIV
jgi:hypothetical protein